MQKVRKLPQRQCLGCREMKNKKELIRVVKSPTDEISLDVSGKKAGRGAYICPNRTCFQQARKTKALERAFSLPIPTALYDAMEQELEDIHG